MNSFRTDVAEEKPVITKKEVEEGIDCFEKDAKRILPKKKWVELFVNRVMKGDAFRLQTDAYQAKFKVVKELVGQIYDERFLAGTESARQNVRKQTKRGLGRRTQQEQQALDAKLKIETRPLRSLLDLEGFSEGDEVASIMKVVKHWLMDAAHDRRTAGELDEQALIERLINKIRDEEDGGEGIETV